jgi:hypothetical protein
MQAIFLQRMIFNQKGVRYAIRPKENIQPL